MRSIRTAYREVFTRERRRSLYAGILLLALSLTFQYYSSAYSIRVGGHFVGDIILDNVPVVNLNPIIVEGALIGILVSVILVLLKPRYLVFTMKAGAIFIALRVFLVAATHLGIYPNQVVPGAGFFDALYVRFGLETGYFFSAHTGLPILMALIFWDEKGWRYLYLAASALFGVSVLLAHVHYTIDVVAAPFMAYSIFKLAQYLFAEDHKVIEALGGGAGRAEP